MNPTQLDSLYKHKENKRLILDKHTTFISNHSTYIHALGYVESITVYQTLFSASTTTENLISSGIDLGITNEIELLHFLEVLPWLIPHLSFMVRISGGAILGYICIMCDGFN